jgi:nicotinate-nucleotide adenylyltransferase
VNIALFGGTFDPIHSGHIRAAKAAVRKFHLDQVLFIPSGSPPHKSRDHLTEFAHRYAMVVLACAGEPRFLPSLLEAPLPDSRPRYSIYTARAVKRTLAPKDRLYFLIGVDALLDLRHWRHYRALLDLVDFIVVSRPGSDARKIREVLPGDVGAPDHRLRHLKLEPSEIGAQAATKPESERIQLPQTTLHILRGVHVPVASRDIRRAVAAGTPIAGLVPPAVGKYIAKERLYRTGNVRREALEGSL